MEQETLISVITVCWNAENEIRETVESVVNQSFHNFEYLIIDGQSTDHTVDLLHEYNDKFKTKKIVYTIISEKDTGIYNAMNKGIVNANGKWIIFLNAGDSFYTNAVIEQIQEMLTDNIDFLYGDANYIDGNNSYIVAGQESIASISNKMPFCHQCIFNKKSTLEKLKFDESYSICADYDLYVRAYKEGYIFQHQPYIISNYVTGGFSQKNIVKMFRENANIKVKNGFITNEKNYVRKMKLRVKVTGIIKKMIPSRCLKIIRKTHK